jgi:hypothetical protein
MVCTERRERGGARVRVKQTFHPLAIRTGQIGAIQIRRLLFATRECFG